MKLREAIRKIIKEEVLKEAAINSLKRDLDWAANSIGESKSESLKALSQFMISILREDVNSRRKAKQTNIDGWEDACFTLIRQLNSYIK